MMTVAELIETLQAIPGDTSVMNVVIRTVEDDWVHVDELSWGSGVATLAPAEHLYTQGERVRFSRY